MSHRTRSIVYCAAIFAAVSLSAAVRAQMTSFTKAQVADRIRKVEDGVDEFRKYLENRGATPKAGQTRHKTAEPRRAASGEIRGTLVLGGIKQGRQKTI